MRRLNIRGRRLGIVLIASGMVPIVVGCDTGVPAGPPSFEAGSGAVFGTVTNPSMGREFVIEMDEVGKPAEIMTNDGGSFSFDGKGNLRRVTSADGSTLDLVNNADGSVDVFINDVDFGEFSFTIEAGKIRLLGKDRVPRFQPVSSALCLLLTAICVNTEDMLPALRETASTVGATLVAPQLVGPGPLGLPTLSEAESFVRDQISNEFSKYAEQIEDFCSSWRELILAEVNPCS